MTAIVITREELYEQVWSEPLQTIAPRFGMSDVALAKNCRKMDIPLPGRGYWAKKAAGKSLSRDSLPKHPPNSTRQTLTVDPEGNKRSEPTIRESVAEPAPLAAAVAAQAEFEANPRNRILVPATLRGPHKLVQKTIDALKAEADRKEGDWGFKPGPRLNVEVSKTSQNRALRIMDGLLRAFDHRRWKTAITDLDRDRYHPKYASYVGVLDQQVFFGMRETTRRVRVATDPAETAPRRPAHRAESTGCLSLVIYAPWSQNVEYELAEQEPEQLENQLGKFVVEIVAAAFRRVEEIAWHLHKIYEEDKAEAIKKLEEQRREDVLAEERALLEQARNWAVSQNVAAYVAAVRSTAEGRPEGLEPGSPTAIWLDWAEGYAASLDPLHRTIEELAAIRVAAPQARPECPPAPALNVSKPQTPYWFFTRRK